MSGLYDHGQYLPSGLYTLEAFGITGEWFAWRVREGWAPDTLRPDYKLRAEDVGDEVSAALARRISPDFRQAERNRWRFNAPRMQLR